MQNAKCRMQNWKEKHSAFCILHSAFVMKATSKIESDLRAFALEYPETHEDFPWGERAIKVKGKAFIFMRADDDEVSLSVKLPNSRDMALDLPWAEPTHYGLGKHGWVTAHLRPKEKPRSEEHTSELQSRGLI